MHPYIENLVKRYPRLEENAESISSTYTLLAECYEKGGKLLVAGNGGSAADADHIVGELMKGFVLRREIREDLKQKLHQVDEEIGADLADHLQGALPAIALSNHNSLNTAFLNDVDGSMCFAQQVLGYGSKNDALLAISTSGNSRNILYAAVTAKAKGMKVIALTGMGGGRLRTLADETIAVGVKETYQVQELHLPVYHSLCLMLEERFFKE